MMGARSFIEDAKSQGRKNRIQSLHLLPILAHTLTPCLFLLDSLAEFTQSSFSAGANHEKSLHADLTRITTSFDSHPCRCLYLTVT